MGQTAQVTSEAPSADVLRTVPDLTDWSPVGPPGAPTVWTAFDPAFARRVAVKLVPLPAGDGSRRWFERSTAALGRLVGQPGVVPMLRTFVTDAGTGVVEMDFCQGGSLQARLAADGPLTASEALAITEVLADALDTAHELELLHLDVTPSNVLFTGFQQPQLADFGLNQPTAAGAPPLSPSSLPYSAPEVVRGTRPTPAADTWMLAATYAAMRTAKAPFGDSDPASVLLRRIERGDRVGLRGVTLSESEQAALDAAFVLDPATRPTPTQFVQRLRAAGATRPAESGPGATAPPRLPPPPTTPPTAPPPIAAAPASAAAPPAAARAAAAEPPAGAPPRKKPVALLAGIGVVAALVIGALVLRPGSDDDEAAAPDDTEAPDSTDAEPGTTDGPGATDGPAPTDPEPGDSTPTGDTTPVGPSRLASPAGMVLIDGGSYPVGAEVPDPSESESLLLQVDLPAFYIDETEVTNAQYAAFVALGAAGPEGWDGKPTFPAGGDNWPVLGVTFDLASAYCGSIGKRLPHEAEWEVAASGPDKLAFPWGTDELTTLAGEPVDLASAFGSEVKTNPRNQSPFGVYDLAGSAWEWVDETYEQDPAKLAKLDGMRLLRGGLSDYVYKNSIRQPVDPVTSSSRKNAGFRCAQSAELVDPALTDPLPPELTADPPAPEPFVPLENPDGYVFYDRFDDPGTLWDVDTIREGDSLLKYGYHPNGFCHIETVGPQLAGITLSPGSFRSTDQVFETDALIERRKTKGTQFSYGLAVRFDGSGQSANQSNGLLFLIDPYGDGFSVQIQNADGTRTVIEERQLPAAISEESVVSLRVEQTDDRYRFLIDGAQVFNSAIPEFTGTTNPYAGLALVSGEESELVHIHFEYFGVRDLA